MELSLVNLSHVVYFLSLAYALMYWIMFPKWRNVFVYITINQIFSVAACTASLRFSGCLWFGCLPKWFLSNFFEMLSLCWPLCASTLGYIKFVLGPDRRLRHEKKVTTGFAVGICAAVLGVLYVAEASDSVIFEIAFSGFTITLILLLNVYTFTRVCWSVARNRSAVSLKRRSGAAVYLIGAGLLCQVLSMFYYIILAVRATRNPQKTLVPEVVSTIGQFLYLLRAVPAALVLLGSRSSREHMQVYLQQGSRTSYDVSKQ